ncbi:MAG: hypothetical protein PHW62_06810 [Candidatus Ratteibacteria bacterium]|nr:hypothetical protein [Candidatus Ratteibacteria bacterium]
MQYKLQTIIKISKVLSSEVNKILPPVDVIRECALLAQTNKNIREINIGHTEKGHPIKAYEFGNGKSPVLFYGFPDPGEAIGGTTILSLLRALSEGNKFLSSLDITWHFIPCLNFDDQPNEGKILSNVFRDPNIREVDWCVSNPRSETTALLNYAKTISPLLTLTLHDEYHSGASMPVYVIPTREIQPDTAEQIRACLKSFGFKFNSKYHHKTMGEGFETLANIIVTWGVDKEDYNNSTFKQLTKYGLVAGSELSQQEGITPSVLVAAQIAISLILINSVLI